MTPERRDHTTVSHDKIIILCNVPKSDFALPLSFKSQFLLCLNTPRLHVYAMIILVLSFQVIAIPLLHGS